MPIVERRRRPPPGRHLERRLVSLPGLAGIEWRMARRHLSSRARPTCPALRIRHLGARVPRPVGGAARLGFIFHPPLAGSLLQRVLHLQTRAWPRPFRPERNRRIRLISLEGDRGHIDIHGCDVDFSGNVVDNALANSFFAFAGAIAASQDTSQERNHSEESHGSIIPFDRIASMRPLSSNRAASTGTRMPNFPAPADVTAPIDATDTPPSASVPMPASTV